MFKVKKTVLLMMKPSFITLFIIVFSFCSAFAQEKNIVQIIDDLTQKWDKASLGLASYDGMKKVCHNSTYRNETKALLMDIHHYDSILYKIVVSKFDTNGDQEAKATLDDILLLEQKYTTKSFLRFLHTDCDRVNEIENNFAKKGGGKYNKERKKLKKELSNYVVAITQQIDIIDKHIHHLKGM